uniref:Uncharacterized protein n=1 Tax=Moniliophthora roreri TaxID=221103 RepID=A0A0W0F2M1_MONRR
MTYTSAYDFTVQDKCGLYRPRPQYPSSGVFDSERPFTPRSGTSGDTSGVQNDPNYATEVDVVNGGVICALTGSNHGHTWVSNLEEKTPSRKPLPSSIQPSEEVLRVNNCQRTDSSSSSSLNTGHLTPNCHGMLSGSSSEHYGTESPCSHSQLYSEPPSPRLVDFSSYSPQKFYMWGANDDSAMAPPVVSPSNSPSYVS